MSLWCAVEQSNRLLDCRRARWVGDGRPDVRDEACLDVVSYDEVEAGRGSNDHPASSSGFPA
jgi:hypothetical protein